MNSPIKAPLPNTNKDGTPSSGINGRKTSISLASGIGAGPGTNMPSSRPGLRRRETSDSFPANTGLGSPINSVKFSKDEAQTPPSLLRRRTDFKDSGFGSAFSDRTKESIRQDDAPDTGSPFGPFRRTNNGPLSAGINGPSSPWSAIPQSAGFPPMGAFGNFSLSSGTGQPPTPGEKKTGFGSLRGESRFKGLMGKDSSEEIGSRLKDKASTSSLEKLPETEGKANPSSWDSARPARPFDTDSKYTGDEGPRTGSAALGGDDPSPPSQHSSLHYNVDRQGIHDDIGFSAFGAAPDMPSFREIMHRRELPHQQNPQTRQNNSYQTEPMSPTSTNPYQSPEDEKAVPEDIDIDDSDVHGTQVPEFTMPQYTPRAFNTNFEGTSDRSQTSSTGPLRSFPNLNSLGGLSGLGTISGWSAAPGAVGTPSRAHPGYTSTYGGDSIFGSLGDLQSSSQPNTGIFGAASSTHMNSIGTIGRGSRMGSLFPTAMQDQMRSGDLTKTEQLFDETRDSLHSTGRNSSINAPGFGIPSREIDSPFRQGRGTLDDLFPNIDSGSRGMQGPNSLLSMGDGHSVQTSSASSAISSSFSAASTVVGAPAVIASTTNYFGRTQDQEASSGISSQIPAAQQRQMVMPDRMRWIYRDPSGNTQGPWSGLEMHDWYKAGFFSPELQVKKQEDADYEPLAQLIRRIGNSREPFLVPQIGIPHGSANAQSSSNAAALGNIPAISPSIQPTSGQPPFASSFPSFGTTLTAEQQNALERRKQEEQYLMARQKEHLAQHQVMLKQMHMQGGPLGIHAQQLHHHSSAHSLQSQPSFGSITSPTGYQPSPAQAPIQPPGAIPGFFDPSTRNTGPGLGSLGLGAESSNLGRDGELAAHLDRLNIGRGSQVPYGTQSQYSNQQEGLSHGQQVAAMLQDRARLQREQDQSELQRRNTLEEHQGGIDRLMQYKHLRDQDSNQTRFPQSDLVDQLTTDPSSGLGESVQEFGKDSITGLPYVQEKDTPSMSHLTEPLSLTEQVQKAASAKQSPSTIQSQSSWAKVETGIPQQFPPPPSISPLPAPAAQRSRQNVADALTIESRSGSQTPSVETPSATIAPWARDSNENSKGPSLKEIQEAEARKTAQREEVAAAARRAIAEQERQNQAQPAPQAPGLPSTSNWASNVSPATPTSAGPSAWTKPLAGKTPAVTTAGSTKKTLTQIQKEEESRKQRLAAAAAASAVNSTSGVPTLAGGKRYADLASKVASPISQGPGGAWTTVGASGKLKAPSGSTATTTQTPRAVSGGSVASVVTTPKPKAVTLPVRSMTAGAGQNANDEFQKWAKGALSKGLNTSINGKYIL